MSNQYNEQIELKTLLSGKVREIVGRGSQIENSCQPRTLAPTYVSESLLLKFYSHLSSRLPEMRAPVRVTKSKILHLFLKTV